MKNIKSILLKNYKYIFGFILGIILSCTTVLGTIKISSDDVQFWNSIYDTESLKTKTDKMYTLVKEYCYITPMPYNFASGVPTSSSTTDYNSLNKSVFIGRKKYNGDMAVCIKRNRARPCFYSNNFNREAKHLLEVYSYTTSYCSVSSTEVKCTYSDFSCYVKSSGEVACTTPGSSNYGCRINADNTVFCGTITIN